MAGQLHIIDARATAHLSDRQGCEELVRLLAANLGLTILALMGYDLKIAHHQEPGVSVVALIAESHMAIHTWPEHGMVQIAVDSCKPFNAEIVTDILNQFFGFSRIYQNKILPRWGPEGRVDD